MRYFIEFAYKGTHYHGWQYQPNAISVQETLNNVFSTLLQENIEIVGAGRTDTGVHASQMYGHFNTQKTLDLAKLKQRINSFLPKDIALFRIIPVHEEAHARFDATSRTYHYYISTQKNVFNTELAWHNHHTLDINTMNEACKILFEYTDFECFSKTHTDVHTFNCKITEAYWRKENENLIFTITADRFLRNMVRAIVGTMVDIGTHKITKEDLIHIIESKDRKKAGFSVPAQGLFLSKVTYPYINESI
ncbi:MULTISPECIES: tRNA pseudouridine(38-40) synthase TruA [Flavobacterium]|uniref:tRNA pseudouridine synthase A n=2 Tax=Flavobacterium TaxID=237 RepID=A0A2N9PBR7_9FLAO|nr:MULTISPECIES: tRNA pseudouridine(38-40) synthase TruA [Flavobacterium]QYS89343.1 tRNA pseudouridine(38-40) synthase TruA [Flavobacterium davisii]RVU90553.1 tRNA pseudouridine(38-40) synthase TruA [Flavobacterium columnare]SPE77802.1 tRNA pseudouridine synthase A [Flavobacterium columnare]